MTVTVKTLIPGKQAENVQTSQYTALNCKTIIDKFTATNTTAGNVVFSVNLVPLAGVPGVSNRILSLRTIAPGEVYACPELVGHALEAGGIISTLCDTATALTISATGREIT